jgi:hypothetical protein
MLGLILESMQLDPRFTFERPEMDFFCRTLAPSSESLGLEDLFAPVP